MKLSLLLLVLLCLAYGVYSSALEGQDPDSQYRLSVQIVHVTNPEEFLRGGGQVKIGIRLHGPFVYNVKVTKTNVVSNPNGTATFDTKKTYTFNPEESIAKEDQTLFTVPNVPYFNLVNSKEDPKLIEDLIGESNSGPFLQKTLQELLWGYEDPLLKLMSEKSLRKGSRFGIFAEDEEIEGMTITVSSSKNQSAQPLSGHYDKIDVYNGNTRFTTWGDELCDEIKGTDLMDPDVRIQPSGTKSGLEPFFFLSSRFCRPLKFSFAANETNSEGIVQILRYAPDNEFFGSVQDYPGNKCYCSGANDCPLPGTTDISKCKPGLRLSRPYFKLADESLRKNLDPSFEPHADEDFLEVEADSGKIASLQMSLQWNVQMKRVETVPQARNFTDILLPLIQSTDIIRKPLKRDQGTEDEIQVVEDTPEAMELASPDGGIKKVVVKKIEKKIEKKLLGKSKKRKSSASTFDNQWKLITAILAIVTIAQLLL